MKIIAQTVVKDAALVITDDSASFYKFAQQLVATGAAAFRPIKLEDGFDIAFLNATGQRELGLQTDEDESE